MKKKSFIFLVLGILLLLSGCGGNSGNGRDDVEIEYSDDISLEYIMEQWEYSNTVSENEVVEPTRVIEKEGIVQREEIANMFIESWSQSNEPKRVTIYYIEEKAYYFVTVYPKNPEVVGGGNEYVIDAMTGEVIIYWIGE